MHHTLWLTWLIYGSYPSAGCFSSGS